MSPTRPIGPCSTPGCPGRATHRGRCAACDAERRRLARAAERPRPTAARRGYGAAWQALRACFLAAHPRCRACGAPATDVDHVVARAKGGTDEWGNLQPLCGACHRRKTNALDGGGWRTRRVEGA